MFLHIYIYFFPEITNSYEQKSIDLIYLDDGFQLLTPTPIEVVP